MTVSLRLCGEPAATAAVIIIVPIDFYLSKKDDIIVLIDPVFTFINWDNLTYLLGVSDIFLKY